MDRHNNQKVIDNPIQIPVSQIYLEKIMNDSHYEPAIVQGEARYQDARRVTLVER